MKKEVINTYDGNIVAGDHPYLQGAWTPLWEEVDATDLKVIEGEIPKDIDGVYLRNTENPLHDSLGRYHPFDGDGMIHMMSFDNGEAKISLNDKTNTFISFEQIKKIMN